MTVEIVVDTETTGLLMPRTADINKQPRIIELAIMRLEDGKIVSEHEWLIDPECEITPEITKITGITNEMIRGMPKFRELLGEIEAAFGGADTFIAHNAPFDKGMIEVELERCARTGFPWPETTLCTVQENFHRKGRRLKLTELYEIVTGQKLAQTHRALDDVRALAEIVMKGRA
jgi:DNA polymerase III subunit epsilon